MKGTAVNLSCPSLNITLNYIYSQFLYLVQSYQRRLKVLIYDDLKVKVQMFCLESINIAFKWLIQRFGKEKNKFTGTGNHEYKRTDRNNCVQSSTKSQSSEGNPVHKWSVLSVTNYINENKYLLYCRVRLVCPSFWVQSTSE